MQQPMQQGMPMQQPMQQSMPMAPSQQPMPVQSPQFQFQIPAQQGSSYQVAQPGFKPPTPSQQWQQQARQVSQQMNPYATSSNRYGAGFGGQTTGDGERRWINYGGNEGASSAD